MPMVHQRLTLPVLLLAVPLLVACNQTAAPPEQGVVGSGALVAIADMQQTRTRHRITSTVLNHAGSFDPTGLSGYAIDYIEKDQDRIEEEKSRRVDEEIEKALAEAKALQALSEDLERRKANTSRQPTRRKTSSQPAN